jgi:hypothetical protein
MQGSRLPESWPEFPAGKKRLTGIWRVSNYIGPMRKRMIEIMSAFAANSILFIFGRFFNSFRSVHPVV